MGIIEKTLLLLTSGWLALAVFLAALTLFHYWCVWRNPLTKTGWKIADYAWLAFGALGLIGATTQARQVAVSSYVAFGDGFLQGLDPVKSAADTVLRRCAEAPQSRAHLYLTEEFKQTCSWMEQNSSRFATIDPSRQIDPTSAFAGLSQFAKPPSLISDMQSAITTHNDWVAARKTMLATTEKSIRENILSVISPILLALALALRITKVTGEILLERAAKAATASKEDRTAGAVQTEDQAAVLSIEPSEVPGSSSSAA